MQSKSSETCALYDITKGRLSKSALCSAQGSSQGREGMAQYGNFNGNCIHTDMYVALRRCCPPVPPGARCRFPEGLKSKCVVTAINWVLLKERCAGVVI